MSANSIINTLINNVTHENERHDQLPWKHITEEAGGFRYGNKEEGIIKDPNNAKSLYEKANKLGNSYALVEIGDMCMNGELGDPNTEMAMEYYKNSALDGNAIAFLRMAKQFTSDGDDDNAEACIVAYIKKGGNVTYCYRAND